MFDKKSILIDALRNPMSIAKMTLDELQDRLGGNKIIADPNTPFCHLLEFGSSIASQVITSMDEKLPSLYAKRADSMEDLYNFMSDFDYLNLYSTPARTYIRFTIPKKYLIANAVSYNTNYKLATIPADTVFIVGKYVFGLYYPINILINNYTNAFTVVYDTTEINPLHELTSNIVSKYDLSYKGLDYLVLDMEVYQFAKSTITESLIAETGYAGTITYNNEFYAIRIFSYSNGKYTELKQSQSSLVYDATVPTALVRVLPDTKKIKVTIPQIYFDNNQMGSKLLIELYTTLGKMNIDTTNISNSSISASFTAGVRESGKYSDIFRSMPFDYALTLSADLITGGTNGISVAELRDKVVSDSLYDRVPITEAELTAYMKDKGFYIKKYLDNITDRIYYAYRTIKDGSDSVVPSITCAMRMLSSYATDANHAAFLYQNADNSITVLPTALYEYDEATDSVVPLTNEAVDKIIAMNKAELADYLNNNRIFRSPFHMRISLNDTYPNVTSFDLYNPSVNKVIFEDDNYEMSEKMMSFGATIVHDSIGTYTVTFSVYKSDELMQLDASYTKIYATTYTKAGKWVGTECSYVGYDETTKRYIYQFKINTNYHLTNNDEIAIQMPLSSDGSIAQEQLIDLTSDFHLVFMLDRTALTETPVEPSYSIVQGVPYTFTSLYLALSRQYINVTLGRSLKDVINNNIEISSTLRTYATYQVDVPKRYTEDVYERDTTGYIKAVENEEGGLTVYKVFSIGDPVLDEYGNQVYEHRKGDIMYGTDGEPIVKTESGRQYYITSTFIDAKMFFSDRSAELTFQNNMYKILESYFDSIRSVQDQLLERTRLSFRCVRSTGMATISRGDDLTEKQNVELSFKIVCYVPSYVKQNLTIQNNITEMTCNAIETAISSKTISMLDIFKEVQSKMSDYIDHFDLLGVNGDTTLQTFVFTDDDVQPSVARKLELTEDNLLSLNKQIDITFVALTNNVSETTTFTE